MSDTPADPFSKPAPPSWAPPPQYDPPPGYGSPPGYGPPPVPARAHSPAAAPVLALVGFAVLVAGLFALPLNSYPGPGQGFGFVETRESVDFVADGRATGLYSGLATFWWLWGVFVVCILVVVLLGLTIARVAAPVVAGLLLAAIAAVGGTVHVLAMIQSVDFRGLQQYARSSRSNFFDHAGAGIWVSIVGFLIVLAGGLVVAATGRRR